MNIFLLSDDPEIAARSQVDKHVVKMVLESAQLLSTCHRVLESEWANKVYKKTHVNHPCSIWARETSANYEWLFKHFLFLLDEYTFRYKKVHKCADYVEILKNNPVPEGELTNFALAMPEKYKVECPVQSYINYYVAEKYPLFKWTNRKNPEWA